MTASSSPPSTWARMSTAYLLPRWSNAFCRDCARRRPRSNRCWCESEMILIVRLGIAEGRDQQRDAVFGGGVDGRISDVMDKLPESGRAELEDRECQIDGGVIVHQPARHHAEQRLRDRQLADRGRTMEKKQFHARSVSRTVR